MTPDWLPLLQQALDISTGKAAANPQSPVFAGLQRNEQFRQQKAHSMRLLGEAWGQAVLAEDIWDDLFVQHFFARVLLKSLLPKTTDWKKQTAAATHFEALTEQLFTKKTLADFQTKIQTYSDWLQQNLDSFADFKAKIDFLRMVIARFYAFPQPQYLIQNSVLSFFVRQTDSVLQQHFAVSLCDKNCRILDTNGIFQSALMDFLPTNILHHKYEEDIYVHSHSLLAHYISTLEINQALKQKKISSFNFNHASWANLFEHTPPAPALSLFAAPENELCRAFARQKEQDFNVIWLNFLTPLYPKWMSRKMPIDVQIKETFTAHYPASKSQEPVLRYLRWAMDTIKNQGVIAFISPRFLLDNSDWQGLRQSLEKEMKAVYLVDAQDYVLWLLVG